MTKKISALFNISILATLILVTACSNDDKSDAQAKTAEKQYIESTPKILTISEALQYAIDGEHRSEKNKARDQYRHPAETLEFFGVKPESTVVELWPGGGWYAEILAPFLREKGTYYAANFGNTDSEYRTRGNKALNDKFAANPEIYGIPKVTALNPPTQTLIAPSNSVDFVLTFRNAHSFLNSGHQEDIYEASFNALKPGGILGVVSHRNNVNTDPAELAKTGYVSEDHIIEVLEKVGFKLIGKSQVNANPKDTKDYENGVWTLPPSLRLKEVDKDKYMAIGESDRMTLKFQKPE